MLTVPQKASIRRIVMSGSNRSESIETAVNIAVGARRPESAEDSFLVGASGVEVREYAENLRPQRDAHRPAYRSLQSSQLPANPAAQPETVAA